MGDPLTRLSVPLLLKPRRRCILVTEYDKISNKDQIVVNDDIEEISSLPYKKRNIGKRPPSIFGSVYLCSFQVPP
jgi:hypothetical protein